MSLIPIPCLGTAVRYAARAAAGIAHCGRLAYKYVTVEKPDPKGRYYQDGTSIPSSHLGRELAIERETLNREQVRALHLMNIIIGVALAVALGRFLGNNRTRMVGEMFTQVLAHQLVRGVANRIHDAKYRRLTDMITAAEKAEAAAEKKR